MSDAVGFLVIPVLAAVAGSLVIWLVSRSRRPPEPEFGDQLRALAPDERVSRTLSRPVSSHSTINRVRRPSSGT